MTRELQRAIQTLAVECDDTYAMANSIENMLEEIFEDHEAQLKAKESDLEHQDMIIKCLNIDLDNKEKLLKAKDEEIKKLKAEKESLCKTIKDLQTANTHWRIYHKDNQ